MKGLFIIALVAILATPMLAGNNPSNNKLNEPEKATLSLLQDVVITGVATHVKIDDDVTTVTCEGATGTCIYWDQTNRTVSIYKDDGTMISIFYVLHVDTEEIEPGVTESKVYSDPQ